MKEILFDSSIFDFQSLVKKYLKCDNLELVHEQCRFEDVLKHGTDQNQKLHRMFYDGMDSSDEFINMYKAFIKDVIYPRYNESILYQKFPTFRVHQPDNIAVFGWHKDKEYNHSPKEVNYYLPLTRSFGNNSIWAESVEDAEDYHPMKVNYGKMIEWDGANCKHGNKTNDSNITRVSFDFRILTFENFKLYPPKASITKGTKFDIGGYFDVL